jgi:hypothetical protein
MKRFAATFALIVAVVTASKSFADHHGSKKSGLKQKRFESLRLAKLRLR